MSVQVYQPSNSSPVRLTQAATTHFIEKIQQAKAKAIRLDLKKSGCSGYMYQFELANQPNEGEIIYTLGNQLEIYISQKAMPILRGTEIDYIKQGINHNLVFNNPNAAAHCGCGESFTLEGDMQA